MIQDKLEDQINSMIKWTGTYPKIIVMHPNTFSNIINEFTSEKPHPNLIIYRGIKVVRSEDVLENEFIVQ